MAVRRAIGGSGSVPRGPVSLTAVPARAPCEAVIPNWHHFLSSKKQSYISTLQLIPHIELLVRHKALCVCVCVCVCAWRTVKDTWELKAVLVQRVKRQYCCEQPDGGT